MSKKGLLSNHEFDIDGVELWERLKKMGDAAGFDVDL